MRIVAGRHRGRRIAAPPGEALRPTKDRVREAIFNILAHAHLGQGGASAIIDARVLDGFAGTGAMGLEALSRGASFATFLDTDTAALACIRANAAALGETARVRVLRADCQRPPRADQACTLVFLDPPYGAGIAPAALDALAGMGWIGADAIAVVEIGAKEDFAPPVGFATLDERVYGIARIVVLRRHH